jgi:hypothetical protein
MSVTDYDAGGMAGPVTARDPMMADHGDDAGKQNEAYVEGVVYKTVELAVQTFSWIARLPVASGTARSRTSTAAGKWSRRKLRSL